MGIYPGTDSASAPGGIVKVIFNPNNNNIRIHMNTVGMDANCNGINNTIANGCGLHIHSGKVCNNSTAVGGHYWTPSTPADLASPAVDPWLTVKYTSNGDGKTNEFIRLLGGNGYNFNSNKGHAFVIHGAKGQKISCGVLY